MAKTPASNPATAATDPKAETSSAEERAKAKAETREFKVKRDILHDGEPYEDGDGILLTKTQHAQLLAVGAIEGEWTA